MHVVHFWFTYEKFAFHLNGSPINLFMVEFFLIYIIVVLLIFLVHFVRMGNTWTHAYPLEVIALIQHQKLMVFF